MKVSVSALAYQDRRLYLLYSVSTRYCTTVLETKLKLWNLKWNPLINVKFRVAPLFDIDFQRLLEKFSKSITYRHWINDSCGLTVTVGDRKSAGLLFKVVATLTKLHDFLHPRNYVRNCICLITTTTKNVRSTVLPSHSCGGTDFTKSISKLLHSSMQTSADGLNRRLNRLILIQILWHILSPLSLSKYCSKLIIKSVGGSDYLSVFIEICSIFLWSIRNADATDTHQELTDPRFWAIVLDRSAVGQLSAKWPGHFYLMPIHELQVTWRRVYNWCCLVVRKLFVNRKVFLMCSWRFWSI